MEKCCLFMVIHLDTTMMQASFFFLSCVLAQLGRGRFLSIYFSASFWRRDSSGELVSGFPFTFPHAKIRKNCS